RRPRGGRLGRSRRLHHHSPRHSLSIPLLRPPASDGAGSYHAALAGRGRSLSGRGKVAAHRSSSFYLVDQAVARNQRLPARPVASLNWETSAMPMGIMAAMRDEIDTLLKELPADSEVVNDGRRTYHSGHLWGTPVVVVFSRWGKVAAATTATHLISDFG